MEYHICLTKHAPARNQHRFYLLSVQPNLFGGVVAHPRVGADWQPWTGEN
jgi:hypothetical protein